MYLNCCNHRRPAANPLAHPAIRATRLAAPGLLRKSYRKIENFSLLVQAHLDRESLAERAAALLLFHRAASSFDLLHRQFANARPDRIRANARLGTCRGTRVCRPLA